MLTGFLAVDADAGNDDGQVDEDYGKLRLLQLPRDIDRPRTGSGAEQLQLRPGGRQRSSTSCAQGDSEVLRRQPADPAGGRRPAVRAAGLRPVAAGRRSRCCSACWWPSVTRSASPRPSTRRWTRCSAGTPEPRPATPASIRRTHRSRQRRRRAPTDEPSTLERLNEATAARIRGAHRGDQALAAGDSTAYGEAQDAAAAALRKPSPRSPSWAAPATAPPTGATDEARRSDCDQADATGCTRGRGPASDE